MYSWFVRATNRDLVYSDSDSSVRFSFAFVRQLHQQFFTVCHHPSGTTLQSPENGLVDLFNLDVTLVWTPFDSDMIGTPCSATVYSVATVFVLLNPEQEVDISNPYPMTEITNTTTTTNSFVIGSSIFCIYS